MQGLVCLITGATSGIGRATALELARRGATVVIVGRNRDKCVDTVENFIKITGNPAINYLLADLSSQKDIHALALQFRNNYSRLDVLVNNAGTIAWTRQLSPDGIELTFALNHIGYFLLTNLLLDVLISTAPSRIINVSSAAHKGAEIDVTDVQNPRRYWGPRAYAQSKLANLLFTYELARRLRDTEVTVNALHPGLVATNLPANSNAQIGWFTRSILRGILMIVGRSVSQGSKTAVYLATAEELTCVTGKYFVDEMEVLSSDVSYDPIMASWLWEHSCQLTGFSTNELST